MNEPVEPGVYLAKLRKTGWSIYVEFDGVHCRDANETIVDTSELTDFRIHSLRATPAGVVEAAAEVESRNGVDCLDPGHHYRLSALDGGPPHELVFVKREGSHYPGNVGHHGGIIMQSLLRAISDRMAYVNNQIPCWETELARNLIESSIAILECRAARTHGRNLEFQSMNELLAQPICKTCGHIGCKKHFHPTPPASAASGESEGHWWCERCHTEKSPVQVTHMENCTRCGSPVEWKTDSEAPAASQQQEGGEAERGRQWLHGVYGALADAGSVRFELGGDPTAGVRWLILERDAARERAESAESKLAESERQLAQAQPHLFPEHCLPNDETGLRSLRYVIEQRLAQVQVAKP